MKQFQESIRCNFGFFCCHLASRKRRCTDVQSGACIMQTPITMPLTARGPPYLSVSICCFKTKLFGGCPNSFPFSNFGEVPACLRLPTQTTERERGRLLQRMWCARGSSFLSFSPFHPLPACTGIFQSAEIHHPSQAQEGRGWIWAMLLSLAGPGLGLRYHRP